MSENKCKMCGGNGCTWCAENGPHRPAGGRQMLNRSVTLHTRRRRTSHVLGGIVLVFVLLVVLLAFLVVLS